MRNPAARGAECSGRLLRVRKNGEGAPGSAPGRPLLLLCEISVLPTCRTLLSQQGSCSKRERPSVISGLLCRATYRGDPRPSCALRRILGGAGWGRGRLAGGKPAPFPSLAHCAPCVESTCLEVSHAPRFILSLRPLRLPSAPSAVPLFFFFFFFALFVSTATPPRPGRRGGPRSGRPGRPR